VVSKNADFKANLKGHLKSYKKPPKMLKAKGFHKHLEIFGISFTFFVKKNLFFGSLLETSSFTLKLHKILILEPFFAECYSKYILVLLVFSKF
jgi:hypothetical protein